jgi:hypothetical protein
VRRWPFAVALVALVVGCGDDSKDDSLPRKKGPVPQSLLTVESASRDVMELALAGKRREVVRRSRELAAVARGPARTALAKIGQSDTGDLVWRTARIERFASSAPLLKVALATNRAFQLMAFYLDQYKTGALPDVTWLRYIEYQARLQAKARDGKRLHVAVVALRRNWQIERPDVADVRTVRRFDAHVKSMTRLADNADPAQTQREAQHGLDLIDELEEVLQRK